MSTIDYDEIYAKFTTDGYAIIHNFVDLATIAQLKQEILQIASQYKFDGDAADDFGSGNNTTTTADNSTKRSIFFAGIRQQSDDYFLESGDKIRYFLERDAVDNERCRLLVPPDRALNKIGHALHWFNDTCRRFTFHDRFKRLARTLRLRDPVIVQSMAIFKHPRIGGEVEPHQDATYLHTLPRATPRAVVGFWLPLEDATEQNGCLEFAPGTHRTVPLGTRWVRSSTDSTLSSSQIRMQHTNPNIRYTGIDFVPVPAPVGSCVLIDGLVVHRSAPNRSPDPRPAYTFHVFDQAAPVSHEKVKKEEAKKEKKECENGVQTWDPNNWLQPTERLPFPSLYEN